MITPYAAFPVYNTMDPVRDGSKSPRAMRVDVLLNAAPGGGAYREINLVPYAQQHQMAFVQGVYIDAIGFASNAFLMLETVTTGHRVRLSTPGQLWTPILATEDLRFILTGSAAHVGNTARLHFTNFEVGASYLATP